MREVAVRHRRLGQIKKNKTMTKPEVLQPIEFTDSKDQRKTLTYGTYLVIRKDGKCHKEVWNGTGWAYNHTVIAYFYLPKLQR